MRLFLAAIVSAGVLAGCASGPTEMGRPPPVSRLGELKPGISTRDEVLRVLGTPQGTGASRMPELPLQEILFYESEAIDGLKVHMKMLVVFVSRDTGVYQGHMWFSSGQLLGEDQRQGAAR